VLIDPGRRAARGGNLVPAQLGRSERRPCDAAV
jgi:hypothetical protein